MTSEDFSEDQCVNDTLCGETAVAGGNEFTYTCFDDEDAANKGIAATFTAALLIFYAM